MKHTLLRRVLAVAICVGLMAEAAPARADSLKSMGTEIVLGGVAVAGAIGVGLFFVFHHGTSIQGCAVNGPDGLEIRTENGANVYLLTGATAGVRAGERVRVKGKKRAASNGDVPTFLVKRVAKDDGPCAGQRQGAGIK